jgi:apolipoprotein N-acyltransferase
VNPPDFIRRRGAKTRSLIALGAGASSVLAFAPFSLFPFALTGPALLFLLWLDSDPRRAFWEGWLYGVGLFGGGVFWMHISIDQFGGIGTFFPIALTLLFTVVMALYYGLVGWLGQRLATRSGGVRRLLLVFVPLWLLLEWLRGWFLTGFPWLALGYSQIDTPLRGYAPLLGVHGVSLAVLLSSALVLLLTDVRRRFAALTALVILWAGGWGLAHWHWTESAGAPLRVSLIQGGIPQEQKWRPERLAPTLELYVRLTRANWRSNLIIWPETAVPALLHQVDGVLLQPLAREAREHGSQLLLGIPVWEKQGERFYNAMVARGTDEGAYYKRHLVPFGEFMPLREWLQPLVELLAIPMSNFSAGEDTRPLLRLAGYPAGVSICYEDAFGEEVIQALPEAAFLVNASNDAWFGDSIALPQHLEIARMRALESGRYLLRVTNTGITALIGPGGELPAVAPPFRQAVLTGEILPLAGLTPYAVVGNWAVVLSALVLLGWGLLPGRKDRIPESLKVS